MQKDFNNLGTWLPKKLEERQMSIEELANAAKIARNLIYLWLRDVNRPTSKTLLRVVHVLSAEPVVIRKGDKIERVKQPVTFEEALKQFSSRVQGRPKGSGSGVKGVAVRSR